MAWGTSEIDEYSGWKIDSYYGPLPENSRMGRFISNSATPQDKMMGTPSAELIRAYENGTPVIDFVIDIAEDRTGLELQQKLQEFLNSDSLPDTVKNGILYNEIIPPNPTYRTDLGMRVVMTEEAYEAFAEYTHLAREARINAHAPAVDQKSENKPADPLLDRLLNPDKAVGPEKSDQAACFEKQIAAGAPISNCFKP